MNNNNQQIIQNKKQMLFNLLQGKVDPNVNAMRQITSKVEQKEYENIVAEGQSVITNTSKRRPMNSSTSRMPKAILDAMLEPPKQETDKLWTPSNNEDSNGLYKSILSEERDIPNSKFNTYEQLNEKLNNYKNVPQTNGHTNKQQLVGLPINEEQIRSIIKEEVYNVLNDIVKQEGENRLLKETIQIRVGKTLFSGNLTPIINKINKK